jgi:hypothetical protein
VGWPPASLEYGYARDGSSTEDFFIDSAVTEIRAFGFSKSGRFLLFAVIVTSRPR